MGLMYIFPTQKEEIDRIEMADNSVTLKTYGLPWVFWGYLAASLVVIFAMGLAIKGPIVKLINGDDQINTMLAYLVSATLVGLPLTLISFFFYEKFITKSGNKIIVTHRIFWTPIWKKTYSLFSPNSFIVEHFLDSPNVAKINKNPETRAFENHGYFELKIRLSDGKVVFLDRHTRKSDLQKMASLLSEF